MNWGLHSECSYPTKDIYKNVHNSIVSGRPKLENNIHGQKNEKINCGVVIEWYYTVKKMNELGTCNNIDEARHKMIISI